MKASRLLGINFIRYSMSSMGRVHSSVIYRFRAGRFVDLESCSLFFIQDNIFIWIEVRPVPRPVNELVSIIASDLVQDHSHAVPSIPPDKKISSECSENSCATSQYTQQHREKNCRLLCSLTTILT